MNFIHGRCYPMQRVLISWEATRLLLRAYRLLQTGLERPGHGAGRFGRAQNPCSWVPQRRLEGRASYSLAGCSSFRVFIMEMNSSRLRPLPSLGL